MPQPTVEVFSQPAAPVAAIPTLSEWGMVAMSSLLALFAIGTIRRRG
ncbi:IPTL-CTERM sorting domain-containing protein [Paracidovorax avenae]|nr:IPTL-CTERM sorting domain-containing protein [Paracidovorax avenae]